MLDRYTKIVLTFIAVALTALVVQLLTNHSAHAQAGEHCVWTYLTDQGRPNLGKNGLVDLTDPDWKKMSDDGWRLKVFSSENAYVFERCDVVK